MQIKRAPGVVELRDIQFESTLTPEGQFEIASLNGRSNTGCNFFEALYEHKYWVGLSDNNVRFKGPLSRRMRRNWFQHILEKIGL